MRDYSSKTERRGEGYPWLGPNGVINRWTKGRSEGIKRGKKKDRLQWRERVNRSIETKRKTQK